MTRPSKPVVRKTSSRKKSKESTHPSSGSHHGGSGTTHATPGSHHGGHHGDHHEHGHERQERRARPRGDDIFTKIQDATEKVLRERKHELKK